MQSPVRPGAKRADGKRQFEESLPTKTLQLATRKVARIFGGAIHPGLVHTANPERDVALTGAAIRDSILGIERTGRPTQWLSVDSTPLFDAGGSELTRIVSTFTDISQQRETES